MSRVRKGPRGGLYFIRGGRKVYLKKGPRVRRGRMRNLYAAETFTLRTTRIERGAVPESTKILIIESLRNPIEEGVLPPGLKALVFSPIMAMTWDLKNLPEGLEELYLPLRFTGSVVYPERLKVLSASSLAGSDKAFINLPRSLERIIIHGDTNLDVVPEGVREVQLVSRLSGTPGRLPGSVQKILLSNMRNVTIRSMKLRDGSVFYFEENQMKRVVRKDHVDNYYKGFPHDETNPASDGWWYLYGKQFPTKDAMQQSPHHQYLHEKITPSALKDLYLEGFPVHNVPTSRLDRGEEPIFPYTGDLGDTALFSIPDRLHRDEIELDEAVYKLLGHWVNDWFPGGFPEFNKYIGDLYSGQREPVADYEHDPSFFGGYETPKDAVKSLVDKIYSLEPIDHETFVYRGLFGDKFKGLCVSFPEGTLVGFHRLMSSSVSFEVACRFSAAGDDGVLLLLELPRGTRCMNISWMKGGQPEIILPPNCVFELVNKLPNMYCNRYFRPPGKMQCPHLLHLRLVKQGVDKSEGGGIMWFN